MTAETFALAQGYAISRDIRGGWQFAGGHGAIDRKPAGADLVATFDAGPRDRASRDFVDAAFRAARVDEWREFLADCGKFTDEIDREIAKEKFTFAELEEEEQSLDRLRRWYRDLKRRDVLALAEAQEAADRLSGCENDLTRFSEHVYRATREPGV